MDGAKEIVIVSGKGGTGKTTLAGALSRLIGDKVIADCDVDAANLYIIAKPAEMLTKKEFIGGKKAFIRLEKCTKCGVCKEVCKYGAITKDYVVEEVLCEGCGACYFLCPEKAVKFEPKLSGYCFTCSTAQKEAFVYAELFPGEENSGKLVSFVKSEAREEAKKRNSNYLLVDGPPGIGCPVISSLAGASLAIIVTEPTPTGIHDLKRIFELISHFQIRSALVVNRADINYDCLDEIKQFCYDKRIVYLGEIPYDTKITEAQKEAKTILEFDPDSIASEAIRRIYEKIKAVLEEVAYFERR